MRPTVVLFTLCMVVFAVGGEMDSLPLIKEYESGLPVRMRPRYLGGRYALMQRLWKRGPETLWELE